MRVRPTAVLFALAALSTGPGARAQETPRFEEQVEVRLIDLQVHVTDSRGNRVSGLEAGDFIVTEDGETQEITNFSELVGESLDGAAGITRTRRPGPAAVGRPPRTLVLFIDYLPLTPPERRELFNRLRDFVHEALQPGDRAMVVHWKNPAEVLVDLTTEVDQVNAALEELANRSVPPEQTHGLDAEQTFFEEAQEFIEDVVLNAGPRLPGEPPQERIEMQDDDPQSAVTQMGISLRTCARRYQAEMDWKTTAMENIISSMAGFEGRKLFVYVASRFPANAATYCQASRRSGTLQHDLPEWDNHKFIERTTDTANAAGVVFYTLRPIIRRGSGSAEERFAAREGESEVGNQQLELLNDSRALSSLAEETGGLWATGAGIFETLPKIIDDLDSYYSIAYRTRYEGEDRERRIDVRVPGKDVEVRVRRALVEKSRETVAKDWLVANLFAGTRAGELDVRLISGEPRKEGNRTILPLELQIPLDQLQYEGAPPKAQFTVMTAAGTSLGVISPIREDTREIERPDAAAGVSPYATYELEMMMDDRAQRISIGVFDPRSGLTSYHVVDQTGASLLDRETLQPSWAEWRALLDQMRSTDRPMLVYLRPSECEEPDQGLSCGRFENETLVHPEIGKRLASLSFSRWTLELGVPPSVWPSSEAGLALMRDDGSPIARWPDLPSPEVFAATIDRINGARAEISRAGALAQSGKEAEADFVTSWVAMHLGRTNEAQRMLREVIDTTDDTAVREIAEARLAFIDFSSGDETALVRLNELATTATNDEARADAWLAIAAAKLRDNDRGGRIAALRNAETAAPKNSPKWRMARGLLASLGALNTSGAGLRLIPPAENVISGRMMIEVDVISSDVAAIEFYLDDHPVTKVRNAPYRAIYDFGRLPEPHTVRVVGRNAEGGVVGEDSFRINDRRDRLEVEILSPAAGAVSGPTNVEVAAIAPERKAISRVEILLGSEIVATMTGAPYAVTVDLPPTPTVLSARAYLSDGSLSEDTVFLNAEGYATETAVHLIEIPLTLSQFVSLDPSDLDLKENRVPRRIETVVNAEEAPLTVGLILDNSASMWERSLDVQAAASEFLERVLDPEDRAFIVTFDSLARLIQEPTEDLTLLQRKLRTLQPNGLTVMNDAIMLGLLQFEATPGRRALVVFSDGVDKGSRHDLDQVLEVARRSAVPIYLIRAETDELTEIPSDERFARQRYESKLRNLIDGSGGNSYMLEGIEALIGAYREIAEDIRRQILVTYLTEGNPDGTDWRSLEIRSKRPGVSLRAPRGVFVGTRH